METKTTTDIVESNRCFITIINSPHKDRPEKNDYAALDIPA